MPGPRSCPFNGKTRKDRLSGKWARHLENQKKRREWNQQYMTKSKGGTTTEIPYPLIGKTAC